MRRSSPARWLFLVLLPLVTLTLLAGLPAWQKAGASSERSVKPLPGARSASAQLLSVADGGKWEGPYPMTNVPVHISLLPNGKLLYWGRDKNNTTDSTDGSDIRESCSTYLADPLYLETGYTATLPVNGTNLFCSGHSFLPDGRLLVAGGHTNLTTPTPNPVGSPTPSPYPDSYKLKEGVGEDKINVFDYRSPLNAAWTMSAQKMAHGRWYPFNVTLGNGDTLIMGGSYWNYTASQVWHNTDNSLRTQQGGLKELVGNGDNVVLTWYPYISMDSTGKVLMSGPRSSYRYDPSASNPPGDGRYTSTLTLNKDHIYGTSVMYAPNKVLVVGGYNYNNSSSVTNVGEYIDLNEAAPSWRLMPAPMTYVRTHATSTILPDGKVLVTGGTSCKGFNNLDCGPNGTYGGAVQTPEMWDPDNPWQWTPLNETKSGIPRVYHSIAMLMPDGRVMIGGGGLPAATGEVAGSTICPGLGVEDPAECKKFGHRDVEFFSPPYLFNTDGTTAVRPAITSAPASISYGQTFNVGVGNVNASGVAKVVLIRLPSVTHTYNQDQRRVVLRSTAADARTLSVTAPAGGNDCPPGPYMMFLVNNNGRATPSVAKIVRVGDYSTGGVSQAFPAAAAQVPPASTLGGKLYGTVSVNAASGVSWTAVTKQPWVTINSGNSGIGNGTITFTVADNTGARRVGAISVKVPGRETLGFDFIIYQSGNFSDVVYPPNANPNFGHKFISNIYARGITTGCGVGTYCPNSGVTRGQLAVFLTTMFDPPTLPTPLTQRFADVPSTHPLSKYIEYISRMGITSGCSADSFCPDRVLTRKEMVVLLLRALGITNPPMPTTSSFDDVPVTDYASPYIEEAVARGITGGCNTRQFCPDSAVTREQMAVFFVTTFGL